MNKNGNTSWACIDQGDVGRAADMARAHLAWRAAAGVDAILQASGHPEGFGTVDRIALHCGGLLALESRLAWPGGPCYVAQVARVGPAGLPVACGGRRRRAFWNSPSAFYFEETPTLRCPPPLDPGAPLCMTCSPARLSFRSSRRCGAATRAATTRWTARGAPSGSRRSVRGQACLHRLGPRPLCAA